MSAQAEGELHGEGVSSCRWHTLPGLQTPEQLDLGQDRSRASGFFGWVHYKAIGRLTGTLDYVLIVTASIVAGVGYHSVILQGDVPNLMPYVGAGISSPRYLFSGPPHEETTARAPLSRRAAKYDPSYCFGR